MDMQNKIHNTPKMDIKQHSNGEGLSIDYDGKIQIITQNKYRQLVDSAKKAKELQKKMTEKENEKNKEIEKLKEDFNSEKSLLQKEINELKSRNENLKNYIDDLLADNANLSAEKQRSRKIQALANRQGKGRPQLLTQEHKQWIYNNLHELKMFGGNLTIKDMEQYLVIHKGYYGGYEPIRAFVSQFKKS